MTINDYGHIFGFLQATCMCDFGDFGEATGRLQQVRDGVRLVDMFSIITHNWLEYKNVADYFLLLSSSNCLQVVAVIFESTCFSSSIALHLITQMNPYLKF